MIGKYTKYNMNNDPMIYEVNINEETRAMLKCSQMNIVRATNKTPVLCSFDYIWASLLSLHLYLLHKSSDHYSYCTLCISLSNNASLICILISISYIRYIILYSTIFVLHCHGGVTNTKRLNCFECKTSSSTFLTKGKKVKSAL